MKKMTLAQHFSELRKRILYVGFSFCIAMILGWYVSPQFQEFLTRPLLGVWPQGTLLYTGMADGLMIRLSLASLFALFVIMPIALWNLWKYIVPALKKNEKNFIGPVLVLSPILFLLGVGFAFYFLFPIVFKFFVELNMETNLPSVLLPVARDYLRFAIGLLKVFGVAFQLPLIMVVLNRLGILKRDMVLRMRRYAIVIIVLVAAVLTPPDVVSQILLAVPMWMLFEISILFMRKD